MKKCFLTFTKIAIGIGVLLGSLYLCFTLWFWNERNKVWAEVEAASERYALANPETSQEELQLLSEDLYYSVLRQKNLDQDGR